MGRRRNRRLLVGPDAYRWRVDHRHLTSKDALGRPRHTDCREILTLRREGSSGRVHIVFRGGPGRLIPDGTYLQGGGVVRPSDDVYLNLHRPGDVRALLDAALANGARFDTTTDLDGWRLLDTAITHRTTHQAQPQTGRRH